MQKLSSKKIIKVCNSEAQLIRVAQALCNVNLHMPSPIKQDKEKFSRHALELLGRTLAKGTLYAAAKYSEHNYNFQTNINHWWEKHKLKSIRFTSYSIELLEFIAFSKPFQNPKTQIEPFEDFLVYLAFCKFKGTSQAKQLASQSATSASALSWLAFPDEFAAANILPPSNIGHRLINELAILTEALSFDLTNHRVKIETNKINLGLSQLMQLGTIEEFILFDLIDEAIKNERQDLLSFLIDAAVILFPKNIPISIPAKRIGGTLKTGSLSERQEAKNKGSAYIKSLCRLGKQHEIFCSIRHFENEYHIAQSILARWEKFGTTGFVKINEINREISAISNEFQKEIINNC